VTDAGTRPVSDLHFPKNRRRGGSFALCPAEAGMTTDDPWSRPSVQDLRSILESLERNDGENQRTHERIELNVPAEIVTRRGNIVEAMTREISRLGIGLLHRGSVSPGEVTVKMASETREYTYRVALDWCVPCDNGMFMSGGRFLGREEDA
jgi:hypothetical protein